MVRNGTVTAAHRAATPAAVPFYRHGLSADHAGAIAKVLETPMLTSGPVGRAVEQQLCAFFDLPNARLTNSWTNGAVATLLALDIGPGDEVVLPAMTFIASANVVELVGATPIFADVDPDTLLLTPESVQAVLTPATRAVIPVHLYGQMLDVAALRAVLGDQSIAIIEDSAHCFEGDFHGHRPGRHSDVAIFSFYATKNVTCGEGGAILTRRDDLFERITQTVLHGMTAGAADRFRKGAYRHWDMTRLGTKANLPDLLAALLPDQITSVRGRLADRERICARYEKAFAGTPIRFAKVADGVASARHLFPIHVPPSVRDAAIQALNRNAIGTTVNYRSVPTLTYYKEKYGYKRSDFPVSHDWGAGTISLPLFPGLTSGEQDHVIDTVIEHVVPLIEQSGE